MSNEPESLAPQDDPTKYDYLEAVNPINLYPIHLSPLPRTKQLQRIKDATKGKVMPNDFL